MAAMELLAPAGTVETFGAALDGGADAEEIQAFIDAIEKMRMSN